MKRNDVRKVIEYSLHWRHGLAKRFEFRYKDTNFGIFFFVCGSIVALLHNSSCE